MSKNSPDVSSLFSDAKDDGVLSKKSMQVLDVPDVGAQIQEGLGITADDVEASEVGLFTMLIDDSGSMDDAQNAVAAAANEMVAQLNNSTLDWRIGLITTYYSSSEEDAQTNSGGTYCNFMTTSTAFLNCLGNVVSSGRGTERGFQSLEEALTGRFLPVQAGTDGKVRPGARVVAIFLSDAGDQSSTG